MKRNRIWLLGAGCLAVLAGLAASAAAAPTPRRGILKEDFAYPPSATLAQSLLDQSGVNNEAIVRMTKTNFAWGAFTAAGPGVGISIWRGSPVDVPPIEGRGLCFSGVSPALGSYAYTRFDVAGGDGNNNTPSDALNMSDSASRIVLRCAQSASTDAALLLRAGGTWWQSSAMTLAATPGWTITTATPSQWSDFEFKFGGVGAVTWTAVTGATDLDEVDNAGETALGLGSPGSPNLANVDGVGLRIAAEPAAAWAMLIFQVQLEATPFPNGAKGWTLYK